MNEREHRFSGRKIRQARFDAGLTQAALATAAGTRERNIIRWENDQHEPRFENVVAIADATGKPLDYFTDDEAEAASMDPAAAEFLEALRPVAVLLARQSKVAVGR